MAERPEDTRVIKKSMELESVLDEESPNYSRGNTHNSVQRNGASTENQSPLTNNFLHKSMDDIVPHSGDALNQSINENSPLTIFGRTQGNNRNGSPMERRHSQSESRLLSPIAVVPGTDQSRRSSVSNREFTLIPGDVKGKLQETKVLNKVYLAWSMTLLIGIIFVASITHYAAEKFVIFWMIGFAAHRIACIAYRIIYYRYLKELSLRDYHDHGINPKYRHARFVLESVYLVLTVYALLVYFSFEMCKGYSPICVYMLALTVLGVGYFLTVFLYVVTTVIFLLIQYLKSKQKGEIKDAELMQIIIERELKTLRQNPFQIDKSKMPDISCAICTNEFRDKENVAQLKCDKRHVFHFRCISSWLKEKPECPICRTGIFDFGK